MLFLFIAGTLCAFIPGTKDLLQAAQTCATGEFWLKTTFSGEKNAKKRGKVQNHREKMFMVRKSSDSENKTQQKQ